MFCLLMDLNCIVFMYFEKLSRIKEYKYYIVGLVL